MYPQSLPHNYQFRCLYNTCQLNRLSTVDETCDWQDKWALQQDYRLFSTKRSKKMHPERDTREKLRAVWEGSCFDPEILEFDYFLHEFVIIHVFPHFVWSDHFLCLLLPKIAWKTRLVHYRKENWSPNQMKKLDGVLAQYDVTILSASKWILSLSVCRREAILLDPSGDMGGRLGVLRWCWFDKPIPLCRCSSQTHLLRPQYQWGTDMRWWSWEGYQWRSWPWGAAHSEARPGVWLSARSESFLWLHLSFNQHSCKKFSDFVLLLMFPSCTLYPNSVWAVWVHLGLLGLGGNPAPYVDILVDLHILK